VNGVNTPSEQYITEFLARLVLVMRPLKMFKRLLDIVFFTRVTSVVKAGRKRPLRADDAPPLPSFLDPRTAPDAYEHLEMDHFRRFTLQVFFKLGRPAKEMVLLIFIKVAIGLSTPVILKAILERIPEMAGSESIPIGVLSLAVGLGLMGMTNAIVIQHFWYRALRGFGTIVNGINRRVVRHTLRLRHSSRAGMNTGDMVNHLSSDTDAIGETAFYLPEFMMGLVDTIAVMSLLTFYLGWGAFVALLTLIVLSPLTVLVANRYRRLDHRVMEARDERVTLMSQILQGIRVVKFQAWEPSVHDEVAQVRKREIGTRIKIVATDAMSTALFISTTTIVAFTGFSAYVLLGGELNAPLVFACIALFAMLEEPFGMISHLLANMQHAQVATTRLRNFFAAPASDIDRREVSAPSHPIGVKLDGVTYVYDRSIHPTLEDIDLRIEPGSSVAIVGAVGSGKSTLLRVMAALHHVDVGTLAYEGLAPTVRPRTAYVPQEAFIMNASVRENITFGGHQTQMGSDHVDDDLASILHDCALDHDIAMMSAGFETEIGERGVNLSGGQKQRVALARAAHAEPGLVFLDDPLSAVDHDTERLIVDRLLFHRWRSITRVVVTHRLAHLAAFDRVIVLEKGRIVADGPFADVQHAVPRDTLKGHGNAASTAVSMRDTHGHSTMHDATFEPSSDPLQEVESRRGRITEDEDRDTGAVKLGVYLAYVRAVIGKHPILAPLTLIGLIGTAAAITVLPILQTSWMGYWTDLSAGVDASAMSGIKGFWHAVTDGLGIAVSDPLIAVSIYGLLGVLVLTGWMGERLLWLYRSAAAGRLIHDNALSAILTAPLRFFDSTPMGRVLNRFARDMEGVDDHLSWNWEQSFKSLSQTIGSLLLIISVMPLIIVVIIPVLLIYYRLQKDYRTAAREAKRLESIARSPRYAHYKEMVTGLDVIHGFGRERFFMDSFYDILSNYQRQFWNSILLNRWFSIRVPIISGFVAVATSIGIVILAWQGTITAGIAGIVLTYALSFWWSLNWTIRAFSEVESRMTSVERLLTYGALVPEPSVTSFPALPIDVSWPIDGAVSIEDLCVRYAPHLPLVLKNVTFSIPARAKVGIVGRTGSGKSTLFQTIFRFIEPESGRILIDGVDITSIPLQRLRRSIAIIPQDPTLFIGSIRSNLDRFNESTDEEIWTALRRVHLDAHVASLSGSLDAHVVEGGMNFSQGQRQLLCMARAILNDARMIVLDEATASVDVATDALIQRTIREEFADVTVLVIAHRLGTVQDADMIITLSNGSVAHIDDRMRVQPPSTR
jgi:ABC-type multidrug transport system fused ATPase/permease subunit